MVAYLGAADKSPRLTCRLSQEQKGLDERALMAFQRSSAPCDALAAGRPATRHRLTSPPFALSPHSLLTDPRAAARAAHGRAAPRAASRRGPSVQRPGR